MLARSPHRILRSRYGKWLLIGLSILLGLLGSLGVNQQSVTNAAGMSPLSASASKHAPAVATPMSLKANTTQAPVGMLSSRIAAQDNFARQDQKFWGTASDGHAWQLDAARSSQFSVSGHTGIVTGAQQVSFYDAVIGPVTGNAMVVFSGSINSFQQANMAAILHWQDSNDWYKAYLDGKHLSIKKDVHGHSSLLISRPFRAQTNVNYTLSFRMSGNKLQASAWQTGQAQPASWMLTFTDTPPSLLRGAGGLRLALQAGTVVRITSFMETNIDR